LQLGLALATVEIQPSTLEISLGTPIIFVLFITSALHRHCVYPLPVSRTEETSFDRRRCRVSSFRPVLRPVDSTPTYRLPVTVNRLTALRSFVRRRTVRSSSYGRRVSSFRSVTVPFRSLRSLVRSSVTYVTYVTSLRSTLRRYRVTKETRNGR